MRMSRLSVVQPPQVREHKGKWDVCTPPLLWLESGGEVRPFADTSGVWKTCIAFVVEKKIWV